MFMFWRLELKKLDRVLVKLVISYGIGCIKNLPKFVTGMYYF